MNFNLAGRISQFLSTIQRELFPTVEADLGETLTAPLQTLIRIWEMIGIERFVPSSQGEVGRPPRERQAVARAFVAKVVFNIPTTVALVERLRADRVLRRLCGFDMRRELPGEHLFSRAFAEFATLGLAAQAHAVLIHTYVSDQLFGHIAQDSTAIEAREKPAKKAKKEDDQALESPPPPPLVPIQPTWHADWKGWEGPQGLLFPLPVLRPQPAGNEPAAAAPPPRKRGRPRKGEVRPPPPPKRIERQAAGMSVEAMLAELPTACDVGTKKNSQGYKVSWVGYKLHLDVADGQIPISAVVTSASVHDSQVSIPLTKMTAERVTSLYEVKDSAYCDASIRQFSRDLGHVPLIDHNPRRGKEKIEFTALEAERYKTRTQVERANARLKDEFGANYVRVRGHAKVTLHLMLGVLVLAADQLLRLRI
jgi:hypothetical protein